MESIFTCKEKKIKEIIADTQQLKEAEKAFFYFELEITTVRQITHRQVLQNIQKDHALAKNLTIFNILHLEVKENYALLTS